jgi:hypothetical protein
LENRYKIKQAAMTVHNTKEFSKYMEQSKNIFDDDLMTHTEVETWSTEALKAYCRKRELKCRGSRKELVSRVYTLYNAEVPEVPAAKEQGLSKKN